jgi:hypothetical protein
MAGTIYVTVLEVSQLTEESRPGHSAIVRSASAPGISNGQSEFKVAYAMIKYAFCFCWTGARVMNGCD